MKEAVVTMQLPARCHGDRKQFPLHYSHRVDTLHHQLQGQAQAKEKWCARRARCYYGCERLVRRSLPHPSSPHHNRSHSHSKHTQPLSLSLYLLSFSSPRFHLLQQFNCKQLGLFSSYKFRLGSQNASN